MKKFTVFLCLLAVFLLVFGASATAVAIPLPSAYIYVGGTPDILAEGFGQPHQDNSFNVNWLAANRNSQTTPLVLLENIEFEDGGGTSGTWSTSTPINYFSLKAGSGPSDAGFALYYIPVPAAIGDWNTEWEVGVGLGSFMPLDGKGISHMRFWVPEPATMLLLGTGLIGLAGLGRRKFLKRV